MGKAELPLHAPGTKIDRGYIGESVPRPNAARLLQGRGAFTDDLRFPRLAHVVFFRSPYAHALIKKLDFETARRQPGVIGVFDGRAVAEYCTPWVAVLAHLKGIKSPPQHAIAIERACWQGEAVAAVVAESRTQAEDAAQLIEAEWEELPVVVDMEDSLKEHENRSILISATTSASNASTTPAASTRSSPRPMSWSRTRSTSAATPACASRAARSSPTTTPASIR